VFGFGLHESEWGGGGGVWSFEHGGETLGSENG